MIPGDPQLPSSGGPRRPAGWARRLADQPFTWLLVMVVVALADYATGPEWSFGAFYMLPVLGMAYFQSRSWSIAVAVLAGLAWLVVDLLTGPTRSHVLVPYWNALVRLAMFAVAGLLLHQVRTLQSRERALMQFLVHDLRNPLTALDLSLQRLGEQAPTGEGGQAYQVSRHLIRRAQSLLDAILELARLEAAMRPVACTPFPLVPLIQGVLDSFRFVLEHHGIQVRLQVEGTGGQAVGDPKLTERVVENILGNAIKASQGGQPITIRVAPAGGGQLQISIADQGPGIPEALRERVFESFVQGGPDAGEPVSGMGLGLSFCRAAVQAQKGRIWLECPPEGGTTMNLSIPAAP